MADLQDSTETAPEPSMEEILASIRKIIADENAPAEPMVEPVDLTQMIQDDGSVVDLTATEMPVEAAPPPPPPLVMPSPVPDVSLMSERKVDEAASAFSSLVSTVAIDRIATGSPSGMALGNGSRTLEDMVIELMRPLLKQWLDQNLPATVDRLVQKEVERIARRAKD